LPGVLTVVIFFVPCFGAVGKFVLGIGPGADALVEL
jgi:hypothetical protein